MFELYVVRGSLTEPSTDREYQVWTPTRGAFLSLATETDGREGVDSFTSSSTEKQQPALTTGNVNMLTVSFRFSPRPQMISSTTLNCRCDVMFVTSASWADPYFLKRDWRAGPRDHLQSGYQISWGQILAGCGTRNGVLRKGYGSWRVSC